MRTLCEKEVQAVTGAMVGQYTEMGARYGGIVGATLGVFMLLNNNYSSSSSIDHFGLFVDLGRYMIVASIAALGGAAVGYIADNNFS